MSQEEKRLEWLRALRRFKYGIKVRARMGLLASLCQQVGNERRGSLQWDAPDWGHDKWQSLLHTSIRETQFPIELLIGFVKTAEVTFFATSMQPTVAKVLEAVDHVCKAQSKEMRRRFGGAPIRPDHGPVEVAVQDAD